VTEFLAQPARPPIPQAGKIHRACRDSAAAQNITSMVIVRARPHDYLCIRWITASATSTCVQSASHGRPVQA
jgi:hypothetical protein